MIEEYKTWLEARGYSESTIAKYIQLSKMLKGNVKTQIDVTTFIINHPYPLVRAFLKCYFNRYLENKDITIPEKHGGNKIYEVMTKYLKPEDVELICAALPKREELISRILYEAASRIKEVTNAKVSDIDFDKEEIKIIGKRQRERIALLRKGTLEDLKEWINTHKLGLEDRLFDITPERYRQILHPISIKTLGKPISSHWFKRSRGYFLDVVMKLGLEERQYALGHSDPKTTQKRYSFRQGSEVLDKIRIIKDN